MEMLDLLETIRAEEASVSRLFSGEGTGVHAFRDGRPNKAGYLKQLEEATRFVAQVYAGKRPVYQLREAMGTSDFPYLFGDIIDRQLWANYQAWPKVLGSYCKEATVSDFRTVKRFAVNYGEAVLAEVQQQTEYPEAKLADAVYQYAVKKYGRRMPFAWEAMVNDDLDALKDVPARFGKAAARSEEKFATQLHVDANGPHASVYTSGNKNLVNATNAGAGWTAVNPPLSILALQEAMVVLANQTDLDGEPIFVEAVTLEVPPALEVTAQNILNATELWLDSNNSAGTANQRLITANWMKGRVKLVVNPYIPIVATTNGGTTWFLHADPNGSVRPAFEFGRLRGHEAPEVFIKQPNQARVGGGIDPMNGDFDTDSIEYKVRHVFGGVAGDPKMTVGSNGSGA